MQLLVQNYLDPSRATEIFFVPKRRIFALPKIVRYRNKSGLQYAETPQRHGKRSVCRSESSASSFNFFSKPLVLTLPPPRPSLGWDRSSCFWSWTCAWDKGDEAACHRKRWCCLCSCPVGRWDKFAKSLRKQESRSRNTRNARKKWSVYLPPRMWECQLKSCALAHSLLRTWKETTISWGIHFWINSVSRPVGSSLESVGYWDEGENPQQNVCCERGKRHEERERSW